MITVDTRAATWIRTRVLGKRYEEAYQALIELCACQWGQCGNCCDRDRHDKCRTTKVGDRSRLSPSCETYLRSRRGYALTPVFRSGTPCRWRCPCPVCARLASLPPDSFERVPPPRRQPTDQLALF